MLTDFNLLDIGSFGFRGSSANGKDHLYDFGHLAMTYTALTSLLILGDDLSKVNRQSIIDNMKELQLESGRFVSNCHSGYVLMFIRLIFWYCISKLLALPLFMGANRTCDLSIVRPPFVTFCKTGQRSMSIK